MSLNRTRQLDEALRMTRRALLLLVFCAALSSTRLAAQNAADNDPDGAQGYVNNVFHQASVDSINLYNGQLTIPIGLGPSYPIGPKLKFQTTLTYNSNVSDFPVSINPSTLFLLPGNPALGIGWTFTLGAIKPILSPGSSVFGIAYFGPDGSQHVLYETPPGSGYYKTPDASQLYLHKMTSGSLLTGYEMWDGDGNRHVFTWQVTGYNEVDARAYNHDFGLARDGWYLTSMADPFGNGFTVDYQQSPAVIPCWTSPAIHDDCGTTAVGLVSSLMTCPSGLRSWIPSTIHLPTGNIGITLNATGQIWKFSFPVLSGQPNAEWALEYQTTAYTYTACTPDVTQTNYYVSAINLPAGLGGSPRYQFSYDLACTGPRLKTITIPTGATISYDWGTYNFYHGRDVVDNACDPSGRPAGAIIRRSSALACTLSLDPISNFGGPPDPCPHGPYWDDVTGIVKRTETVGSVSNVTDYIQYSFPWGEEGLFSPNCDVYGTCPSQTLTLVVFPPDVDSKRRATSTLFWAGPKYGGYTSYPGGRVGAEIRQAEFDSDPTYTGTFLNASTTSVCGGTNNYPFCPDKAVRVTERAFEYDDVTNEEGNRRLLQEKKYYGTTLANGTCPTCLFHQVLNSNLSGSTWDGNGRHYNVEAHSGTLGGDTRTTTTYWTPPSSSPTLTSPWLPNLFTRRTISDSTLTLDRYTEFNAKGFLRGSLLYDAAGQRLFANCRYADLSGNLGQEFSGIFFNWVTPPPYNGCSLYFPAMPVFNVSSNLTGKANTYQNGQLLTSRWWNGGSPAGWTVKNFVRDARTGWVTSSTDSAGKSTAYYYDSIGRVTSVTPPDEAVTLVSYPLPTQTLASRNGGAGLATSNEYDYDALGRLIREIRLMPGSSYAKRFTLYDGRGYDYFKSEWVPNGTSEAVTRDLASTCSFSSGNLATTRPTGAKGTFKSCFDPFGRPQSVIGPSHTSRQTVTRTDASVPYSDTLEAVTTSCINGTFSSGTCQGGTDSTTTLRTDAFGRKTSAIEPTSDVTFYAYDVNDNLTSVVQGGQTRTFTYDPAGNLRLEVTPEKGTVTYDYGKDTAGTSNKVVVRVEPGVTITTASDYANRVLTIATSEGRTYAANTYDEANRGYSLGKLTTSVSSNFALSGAPSVTDSFTYSGTGGRLSSKTTQVTGSQALTTTQSWGYNSLGLVSSYSHPRASGDAAFAASSDFNAGLPVNLKVNGTIMASGIGYWPSGAVGSYTTNNGTGHSVTTTLAQDPSFLSRPSSIATSGSSSNFTTGTYSYDGAGNVRSMGPDGSGYTDTFTYDVRSRLLSDNLYESAVLYTEGFSYNRYGSMLTHTMNGSTVTFDVDANTNRLVTGAQTKYDVRGNLTLYGTSIFEYDGLSRQTSYKVTGSVDERYLYDTAGERVARVLPAPAVVGPVPNFFYNLPSCRVIDTRGGSGAISGQTIRTFPANNCGIPANAKALAANVTSTSVTAQGYFRVFPAGAALPSATTNAMRPGQSRATQAFVSINGPTPGSFSVFGDYPAGYTADFILDVSGYFAPLPSAVDSYSFTLRDDKNQLATQYRVDGNGRALTKDYLYLGNMLLATQEGATWKFYASDHLGTARLVTDTNATMTARYKNRAFGLQLSASAPGQAPDFAGMEKDLNSGNHYDHARFYGAWLGRFQSPDKVGGKPSDPQSWNRYAYAKNNPLKYVDPDGRAVMPSTEASQAATDYQNQKRTFDGLVNAQTMRANWSNGNYWFEVATAATNTFLSDPTLAMLPSPMALEVPGEASLLKLTSGNFRQNLMRSLGKSAEEIAGKDAHHMLAQADKFAEKFSKVGLNIHDPKFGAFWDRATHQGLSSQFNADWTAFLSKDRTAEQIQKYARVLAVKYDIPW